MHYGCSTPQGFRSIMFLRSASILVAVDAATTVTFDNSLNALETAKYKASFAGNFNASIRARSFDR